MATFLDIALLQQASPIFVAIFVWVVIYALMQMLKFPGEDKNLHAIISLMLGLFVLFLPNVRDLISVMAPWFVLLFIIILFVLIAIRMLGVSQDNISSAVTSREGRFIIYFVIAFAVIIIAFSFSTMFGQNIGPFLGEGANDTASTTPTALGGTSTATDDFNQNMAATLFHPKILGMVLLLVIASFTIRLLARAD
jgi:hypothetical protein